MVPSRQALRTEYTAIAHVVVVDQGERWRVAEFAYAGISLGAERPVPRSRIRLIERARVWHRHTLT